MSEDRIVQRVARSLAAGDPLGQLERGLPATDLQSLMLHVYRERSGRRTPGELMAQHERSNLVQPSAVDARALLGIEQAAFEAAAAFEALELSPVAPLGINTVLGRIDQNSCLATVRGAEVMSDPTTAQALECARRRRAGHAGPIKLCSRSRQLRLQPFDNPKFSRHFGLFSLVSAGRDSGGLGFEMASLREHLGCYLDLLSRLGTLGYRIRDVDIALSDTAQDARRLAQAAAEVLAPLAAAHPAARFRLDPDRTQALDYYSGLCLRIDASTADGQVLNLGDGGFTDWTRRLCANAKERLLVSGLGIELFTKAFR